MNKKKLFVLLPAVMLTLAGCNETNSTTSNTNTSTTTTVVEVAQPVSIEAEHGSVVADKTEALVGEEVTLTVSVDEGYHFVDLKVNGASVVVNDNVAKVTMVEGGLNVKLEVAQDTHNVTIAKMEHGNVTADKAKAVVGEKVTLTVAPEADYELDKLLVNGAEVKAENNVAVVDMVKGGLAVSATFKQIKYTVTVNVGEHGKAVADKKEVVVGEKITLSVTPDADYKLNEVKVNGKVHEGLEITADRENLVIEVSFVAIDYDVTVNPAEHGSVSASVTNAAVGEDVVLTVAADDDYELSKLLVNGAEVAVSENKATVKMVSGGLVVSSEFKAIIHTVTIDPVENGSVVADKMEAVTGENIVFTVTPATGYKLESFIVNTVAVEVVEGKATVAMAKDGLKVTASFTNWNIESEMTPELKAEIEAADTYKLKLGADMEVSEILPMAKVSTEIDLNGHTLKTTNQNLVVINKEVAEGEARQNLKIFNGSIVADANPTASTNIIDVSEAGLFEMDNVNLSNTNEYPGVPAAIYCSNTSNVVIKDSTINFKGTYGVGTNNTEGKNGTIRIENSTITVTTAGFDNAGMLGNTEGINVTIINSKITGDRQGVIARTGTWNVSGSTFTSTGKWLENEANVATNNNYLAGTWKSGNEVPAVGLNVGDTSVNAYNENVSFTATKSSANSVVARADGKYTNEMNIDAITFVNTYNKTDIAESVALNLDERIKFVTPDEINAMIAADDKNLYVVTGVVSYFNSSKPNWSQIKLQGENGEMLSHYTIAQGAGTFAESDSGVFSFSGERKAVDASLVGKTVTLIGCVKLYKGAPQMQDALVVDVESVPATVALSFDETKGTASLSKNENVMMGDEITVTATANDGFKVAKITVADGEGNETDITASKTFVAGKVNNVNVEFVDASAVVAKTFNVAFNKTNNNKGNSSYSDSFENTSDGMTFVVSSMNNNNNQWEYVRAGSKKEASIAFIVNKTAFENAIGKTSITIGSKYEASLVNSFKLVVASDDQFANVIEEHDLASQAKTGTTITTEITTPTKGAYYKYVLDLEKGSGNGFVEISALSFEEVL